MKVVVEGEASREEPVLSGVPQETVLGSLFSLCCIIRDRYAKGDIQRFIGGSYRSRKEGNIRRLLNELDSPTLQARKNELGLV
jgi:hypothetical protein